MKTSLRAACVWCLFAGSLPFAPGCGDDELEELANDPPAGCRAVLERLCDAWIVPCTNGLSVDECMRLSDDRVNEESPGGCDDAVATSSTFVECMEDIDDMTCSDRDIPPTCRSVILF